MINLLIKFTILVWPFGHFLRFTIGESLIVPLLDILVFVLFLLSLPAIIKNKEKIKIDPVGQSLAIFLFLASLSLIVRIPEIGIAQMLKPSLYLFRLLSHFSLYFVFSVRPIKKYRDYLKLSAIIFVIFGLAQYIFSPNMSFIQYLGFDDHYFRLIGTFLDPNYTGALLSSLSVLLLAQGRIFPSLLLLVPLGLTFSRASYLSLVVPLALLALLKRKYIYVLLPLLLVLAVIIAPKPFGEGVNLLRTFSIFSRLGSWQEGMSLFVQRPLLGFGYNTLTTDTGRIGIDNSFIYLLATTGILGLASFLYFLYLSFIRISLPLRLSLVSLLIHALFNNTLFFPWITVFLIVLILKD